jgi:hypothetical protein
MTIDSDKVDVRSRRRNTVLPGTMGYIVMIARMRSTWRAAVLGFIVICVFGLAALFAAIVLIDPYDSGRFPSLIGPGVSDADPRTANVSRGRDQSFNAAIFGNSRAMLLNPARLDRLTGFRFVQLIAPSSGAREQATLLHYFARLHDKARAVIMMVDPRWCQRDPAIPPQVPFPFELYGDDLLYFSSMLNTRVIVKAYKRVMLSLGKLPATDRSGYVDLETDRLWTFHWTKPQRATVDLMPASFAKPPFPALEHMEGALSALSPNAAVVLFWPPFYYTELPEAGSEQGDEIAGCKYDLMTRAMRHRNWRIADYLLDTPMSRDPTNFLDSGHFRRIVAEQVERRMATMFAEMP